MINFGKYKLKYIYFYLELASCACTYMLLFWWISLYESLEICVAHKTISYKWFR